MKRRDKDLPPGAWESGREFEPGLFERVRALRGVDIQPGEDYENVVTESHILSTRAVQFYLHLRAQHRRTAQRAALGYWAAQIGTVLLAGITPLLILFSAYPNLVKAIPAALAAVLAAFNGLLDWRGLAGTRGWAVAAMDTEFRRFQLDRGEYRGIHASERGGHFSDKIEAINRVAETAAWFGFGSVREDTAMRTTAPPKSTAEVGSVSFPVDAPLSDESRQPGEGKS